VKQTDKKKMYSQDGRDRLLPKFSLFIFDRPRTAAIIWLCLTVFGIASYTTLLKKEGFPSIDIPYAITSGAYVVNDPARVDREVAKPISDIALKQDKVKSVQTQSQAMGYAVITQYEDGTDVAQASKQLQQRIEDANILPKEATLNVESPKIGFTARGDDAVITVYAKEKGSSAQELQAEAEKVTKFIESKKLADIESISPVPSFETGVNPLTGQTVTNQTSFDRYATRQDGKNTFYDSVAVGISQRDGTDVIDLETNIQAALSEYNGKHQNSAFSTTLSATYAHDIKDQIGELQKSLLEGILFVLLIGSVVIAFRASLITVLAMLTVLAITLGVLLGVGYTLNTITLFSLVLCLGLIVDDTIIMVEALDAQRRRRKDAREVVQVATRKVSRAMVAATLTAVLSFAPLLFIGGILGGFIRAIPVTVITSLLVSLLVALIFIPLFARFLLLGKKQMGPKNVHEPAAAIEEKIARFIGRPMLWARHSTKKLFTVGIIALVIGFGFVGAGMALFSKVTFNIFPPSKDTNGLMVTLQFTPGTTIQQAEAVADKADAIIAKELGENLTKASYYANASDKNAMLQIGIIPYQKRDVRSPELVKDLQGAFKGFEGADITVGQQDIAPPLSAFNIRIETDNRQAARALARDMQDFLQDRKLTRPSGEVATITKTSISDENVFTRADGELYLNVSASYDSDDTTTLVTLTKDAVNKEFTENKIASYGLEKDAINFDAGQEDENQESFASLAMAFPILLLAIYVLLAVQFRSLAQPLLIFMALPFSLFGITLGLFLTDNAFGFFSMLGFFALIGLSIKNTILLTDYANQLRREGMGAVDAAVGALGERFRPLIATSLTAVASLIPLAIQSPFWEGLAVVLIFGLLSSTFLVLTVFPYYYLGAEYLRMRISRRACLLWLGLSIAVSFMLVKAGAPAAIVPLIPIVLGIGQALLTKRLRQS
jgi:multidrug efflux pump subunit AcrB